ncbi:MAG: hypothetical protein AAF907_12345 [Planctomycetota bacterium]
MPASSLTVLPEPTAATEPTDSHTSTALKPPSDRPSVSEERAKPQAAPALPSSEPTVRAILRDAAAPATLRPPARLAWLAGAAAAGPLWACFDPVGWGPLAWVALVPLCLLIRSPMRTKWEIRALWLCSSDDCLSTLSSYGSTFSPAVPLSLLPTC